MSTMTLQSIKKCFQGYALFLTEGCGQRAWHYFDNLEKLACFCVTQYRETLYPLLRSKVGDQYTLVDLNHAVQDRDFLINGLAKACEDFVLIDFGSLIPEEWAILQKQKGWKLEEDYLFWQSFCKRDSVKDRLKQLGLSEANAAELFGVSAEEFSKQLEYSAGTFRIIQLARIEAKINRQLDLWLKYACQLKQSPIGIPYYDRLDDFNACDQDTLWALPYPFLYKIFYRKLMEALTNKGIQAEHVIMDTEEYCDWLNQNSFESCYGARIAYATERLNRRL